jgi:hypothetical protein
MFEDKLQEELTDVLGEYIHNWNASLFKLDSSGTATVRGLTLRPDALGELGLPICLAAGRIGIDPSITASAFASQVKLCGLDSI